jgi:regulator of protease activity HflC (stomatin/prohibitin superfamily)
MVTFLCILIILAGIAGIVLSYVLKHPYYRSKGITAVGVGIGLLVLTGCLYYASAGHCYMVQYYSGTQRATCDPGFHFKWWGQLIEMKQVMTVKCNKDDKDNGDFSAVCPEIDVRFNDAVEAKVSLAARFHMPGDPEKLKKLFVEYRTQDNLLNASLIPITMEAVRNSSRLLSAQEYMVGKGGEFEQAVLDQMTNGIYILETETVKAPEAEAQQVANQPVNVERKEMIKLEVRKKVDGKGGVERKHHVFLDYGIAVSQATVEKVDPEQKFKDMLGQQRDAAAKGSVERQNAQTAEFSKQRIVAEGEAEKSKIQVEKEKAQVEARITAQTAQQVAVIEAETRRAQAEKDVQTQRLALDAARLEAQKKIELATAEGNAKRLLQQANGSLEAKLAAWKEANVAYANAFGAKGVVPQIVIGSSGGGNWASELGSMLMLKTAKDLALDLTPGPVKGK